MNEKFLEALRRNTQSRQLSVFLDKFGQSVDWAPMPSDIIDAALSVRAEQKLYETVKEKYSRGTLTRTSELTYESAFDLIKQHMASWANIRLMIFLCHYPDFAFWISSELLQQHLKAMLDFDGDSIYSTTDSMEYGCGISVYVSEICRKPRFEVDLWKIDHPVP